MLPPGGHVVTRGEIVDHLYVGGQSRTRKGPFEQIVAEKGVVRDAPCQRRLEGINIVDALAGVGAFSEQVLIDIRNRRRVGIYAARSRKRPVGRASLRGPREAKRSRGVE